MKRLVVERASDGTLLWTVDVADSWGARLRGLIGRRSLADGEGLYLPGTNSIHMFFMRFAIDCVFVGAEQEEGRRTVVAVRSGVRPWTGVVWWVRGAKGVIEVPEDSSGRAGIVAGEEIRFSPLAAEGSPAFS